MRVLKELTDEGLNGSDLYIDYDSLGKELLSKLDPSIRSRLSKKGLSITQNIYTGFDTEYRNIDIMHNELLSVQLAVNSKTMIQFPLLREFDYNNVEVSSGRDYDNSSKITKFILRSEVKDYINETINYIRELKYGDYDASLDRIVKGLIRKDVKSVKQEDFITFIFDRSVVKLKYIECNRFKFKDIVKTSNFMARDDLEEDLITLKDLLKSLNEYSNEELKELDEIKDSSDLSVFYSQSDEPKDVKNSKEKYDSMKRNIENLALSNIKTGSDLCDPLNVYDERNRKYSRTNNTSYTGEIISVTRKVNNYLLMHFSAADISILEDFEEFKSEFDIVNKSFVTLNKPILIDGVNVILRDTLLISPMGYKSLKKLSNLYDEISKVEIPEEYIDRMDAFKRNDPKKFEDYATQDSLITLLHGSYMEDFNHSLNLTGVPLTLSGLSSAFIKEY